MIVRVRPPFRNTTPDVLLIHQKAFSEAETSSFVLFYGSVFWGNSILLWS